MTRLALVFPGQGSQHIGMGKRLSEQHDAARDVFAEANEALGFDLSRLCFEGPLDELTLTKNSQPAILASSIALYRVYEKMFAERPVVAAGHSLGEFTALVAAGALELKAALRLVRKRGELMQEAAAPGRGTMAAVLGVAASEVRAACAEVNGKRGVVVISNSNAPDETVISGDVAAVLAVGENLRAAGARVVPLNVSAPFHSPLMAPAAERFAVALAACEWRAPSFPVLSNVSVEPHAASSATRELLMRQLTEPVDWTGCMKKLSSFGAQVLVEMGPGVVLTKLAQKNCPELRAFAFDRETDQKELGFALAASKKNGQVAAFKATVITRCLAVAVCVKNRNPDGEAYRKGVIEPYRKIQRLQEELERSERAPTLEQQRDALRMLGSTFEVKGTPEAERRQRFEQIFAETGTRDLFPEFTG